MDKVVAEIDGRPVTATEQILADLRIGNYLETASKRAGLSKDTTGRWTQIGARAWRDVHEGRRRLEDLTDHETACLEFSRAVDRAMSESETRLLAELERASRGGRVTTTVVEKRDANGQVIERSERTTTEGPDLPTLRWRLERKFPDRWGRQVVEVTGAEGGPIEVTVAERAASIAEELARFQAQQPDPATNGH